MPYRGPGAVCASRSASDGAPAPATMDRKRVPTVFLAVPSLVLLLAAASPRALAAVPVDPAVASLLERSFFEGRALVPLDPDGTLCLPADFAGGAVVFQRLAPAAVPGGFSP